ATAVAIQELVRSLTYQSVAVTAAASRTVRVKLSTGDGRTTQSVGKTIDVAPIITGFGGTLNYTKNGPATQLDGDAQVSANPVNFDGGQLTAWVPSGIESDRLTIGNIGGISIRGQEVLLGGSAIGTFTGGSGAVPLVVTFNSGVDAGSVQAVLRSISY